MVSECLKFVGEIVVKTDVESSEYYLREKRVAWKIGDGFGCTDIKEGR